MWLPRYSLRTLRIIWIAIVLWCEIGIFISAGARCHWPDPGKGKATHILLVADPQILDERSYLERSSLLRALSRIFVDMNLRKAWHIAKSTRPHAVIFLGDMMDNGFADMHITKYQEYVQRFRSIFSAPQSLAVYYIPGNHDVGLGNGRDTSTLARPRYKAAFGPLAQHVVLGGHSLLMVDAPALVDEDWRRDNASESRTDGLPQDLKYLQHLRAGHAPDAPLILFSHVPLYRSPNSDCGPLREKGSIPAVRGEGYQTLLSPETSQLLLKEFRPALIFSGDDHDYCEHTHTFLENSVPEVTVKSISIAMGIHQPGFQLLSLSSEPRTRAHRPCALPDQLRVYTWVYAPLVLATIVLVAVRSVAVPPSRLQKHGHKRSLELPVYRGSSSRPPPASPRKRSYPVLVTESVWAVAWPPLAVYAIIAATVFW
ncbi:Metallo-dependent phosphatase-like protein [Multifurca ochricompacta]|uniref:Metallo-dependent phosphatase-like protein n=1 Tax=Multifurca ochricompacta TaxID=376703 RepID=A0AAD4QQX6_9AGAM|nr:Metallo-dependent phosphatase-like protein [Multifurca ochricompacta]